MLIPVILSGGSGSRLWPLSRELNPKQFLSLYGEKTLLQNTVLRAQAIPAVSEQPIVVCNAEHRFMVAEQLRQIDVQAQSILLESVARNTAPAIVVAALQALTIADDPLLLILPSDHMIGMTEDFNQAVVQAVTAAEQDYLLTFGITPAYAETGYGYIKATAEFAPNCYAVDSFIEKPDVLTAREYIKSGSYYWNSGMFLFKASSLIAAMQKSSADIVFHCQQALQLAKQDLDFLRLDETAFAACPVDSIDYALMEKASNVAMVSLNSEWSDIGSWRSLYDNAKKDQQGNVTYGDVLLEETTQSLVHAEKRLVAVLGMQNCVVIETKDAVLVADMSAAQQVKTIVAKLQANKRKETINRARVYRPWGAYELLDQGEQFQVKRLIVNSGAKLSLQMHYHRAEHWVVMRGRAKIIRAEESFELTANQSTYIPLGVKHSLENTSSELLEVIEIQSGHYLGEDDIVRFDDVYGRCVTD